MATFYGTATTFYNHRLDRFVVVDDFTMRAIETAPHFVTLADAKAWIAEHGLRFVDGEPTNGD